MMKNIFNTRFCIFLVILLGVILCTYLLFRLNAEFTANYWINFTTSILTNLIVVGFALLVIERIIESSRLSKFKAINAQKSDHIAFLIERLEFKILVFMGLIEGKKYMKEKMNHVDLFPGINEDFKKHLRGNKLTALLWGKIEEAKRSKSKVIDRFTKILKKEGEMISDLLKEIHPQPDPDVVNLFKVDIPRLTGSLEVPKLMLNIESEVSKMKIKKSFKITAKEKTLLAKVAFINAQPHISKVLRKINDVAKLAKENKLFVSL